MLEICAENYGGAERKGISLAKLVILQWVAGCLSNCEKSQLECKNCAKGQYTPIKDDVTCIKTVITLQSGDKF